MKPRIGRRVAGPGLCVLFLLGAATAPTFSPASANQSTWTRGATTGTCPTPSTGNMSVNRFLSTVPKPVTDGKCHWARTPGADSSLRTSGSDVYAAPDGYFIGTPQLEYPNTHQVRNRWTVTINLCVGSNYFVTRNSILSTNFANLVNQPSTGYMSHRASSCIDN